MLSVLLGNVPVDDGDDHENHYRDERPGGRSAEVLHREHLLEDPHGNRLRRIDRAAARHTVDDVKDEEGPDRQNDESAVGNGLEVRKCDVEELLDLVGTVHSGGLILIRRDSGEAGIVVHECEGRCTPDSRHYDGLESGLDAEEADGLVNEPELLESDVEYAEIGVVCETPAGRNDDERDGVRQQIYRDDQLLALEFPVADEGENQPEHHGRDDGAERPDESGLYGLGDIFLNELKILQPAELTGSRAGGAYKRAETDPDERVCIYEGDYQKQGRKGENNPSPSQLFHGAPPVKDDPGPEYFGPGSNAKERKC